MRGPAPVYSERAQLPALSPWVKPGKAFTLSDLNSFVCEKESIRAFRAETLQQGRSQAPPLRLQRLSVRSTSHFAATEPLAHLSLGRSLVRTLQRVPCAQESRAFWPATCGHSPSSLNQPASSLSLMGPLSNRQLLLPQQPLLFPAWLLCSS